MSTAPSKFSRRAGLRRFAVAIVATSLAVVLAAGPGAGTAMAAKKGGGGAAKTKMPKTLLPLKITNVIVQNGQLFAVGTLGAKNFVLPIDLGARPNPADADCPILDLEIQAITLNLLGLLVETSDICLAITAHEGEGLLGDLLCGVANLLQGGIDLGMILDGLTDDQLEVLLTGIEDLLNDVFAAATAPSAVAGASCNILNLSLGPIDLNLLGLQVELDNCADGPVTIDVTAIPGGGLLGDLLCSLANLLNGGGGNLADLLNQVATAIRGVIARG